MNTPKELPNLSAHQHGLVLKLFYRDNALLVDDCSKRAYFCDENNKYEPISIITFQLLKNNGLLENRYDHGPFQCWRLNTPSKLLIKPEIDKLNSNQEVMDIKSNL